MILTPGPEKVSAPSETEELGFNNNNINCLSRSHTFSSGGPGTRLSPRRRLPQIPQRPWQPVRDKLSQSYDLRTGDDGPIRGQYPGHVISLDQSEERDRESRPAETDSGYPSYDAWVGEETSVDSPSYSSSSVLLPKRNSSNFLWVDFKESGVGGVQRRPKNHDRKQKWS